MTALSARPMAPGLNVWLWTNLCCCISSGRFTNFSELLNGFTRSIKDVTVEHAAHCDYVHTGPYTVACICMSLHQISQPQACNWSCKECEGKECKGKAAQQLYRNQYLLGSYDLTCCGNGAGLSMMMATFTLSNCVALT